MQRGFLVLTLCCRWQGLPGNSKRGFLDLCREQGEENSKHNRIEKSRQRHSHGSQWSHLCLNHDSFVCAGEKSERRTIRMTRPNLILVSLFCFLSSPFLFLCNATA